jgi:hypothetical protein
MTQTLLKTLLPAALLALATSGEARAQSLDLNIDPGAAQSLGLDAQSLEADINNSVSNQLNLPDLDGFLKSMASAATIGSKGMGADYGSNFKRFIVGGSLGTGVSGTSASFTREEEGLPSAGFAFQLSAMAGLNLGVFTKDDNFLDRVKIYGHFMALDNLETGSFTAGLRNFGAMVQVNAVQPKDAKVVGWGGLAVTTGFTQSRYALLLEKDLPLSTSVEGYGSEIFWNAAGDYGLTASVNTIPLELSTNVHLLKVFSLFGGAGADINMGGSTVDAVLQGPIETEDPDSGDTVSLGTASLSLTQTGDAPGFSERLFVGAQLNVVKFRLYGVINSSPSTESFGGNFGLRFAL